MAAAAAGFAAVPSFGSNPGNLTMYEYDAPDLPANRPVVVAMHGGTQTGTGYCAGSGCP